MLIYILLFRSWTTYGDILYPSIDQISDRPHVHHYTLSIFLSYFLYFIALLIFIRSWFIYYDWQRNAQLLSLRWKKLLKYNSFLIQRNTPWTLTCSSYLGNMKFLISCAIFLFIICEIVVCVTSWDYDPITYYVVLLSMNIFTGITATFLFYQSLKLKDCIGIRAEIGTLVILFVLLAIFYIVIIIIFPELSYERTLLVYGLYSLITFIAILRMTKISWLLNNVAFGQRTINKVKRISHAIQDSIHEITAHHIIQTTTARKDSFSGESTPPSNENNELAPLPIFLPTPNNKIPTVHDNHALNLHRRGSMSIGQHICMHRQNQLSFRYGHSDNGDDEDEGVLPKLYQVLSDEAGFELFAAHLIKELSAENILFLIELFELKETLIQNGYIDNDFDIKWRINIENDQFILSLTAIDEDINDENMTQKCIDFALYLYDQYIATNSHWTINVKSRTRAKIENWINKHHDDLKKEHVEDDNDEEKEECLENRKYDLLSELFVLLHDRAGQEVYLLLSLDSYYRFSQTQQFKAWNQLTNGVDAE